MVFSRPIVSGKRISLLTRPRCSATMSGIARENRQQPDDAVLQWCHIPSAVPFSQRTGRGTAFCQGFVAGGAKCSPVRLYRCRVCWMAGPLTPVRVINDRPGPSIAARVDGRSTHYRMRTVLPLVIAATSVNARNGVMLQIGGGRNPGGSVAPRRRRSADCSPTSATTPPRTAGGCGYRAPSRGSFGAGSTPARD